MHSHAEARYLDRYPVVVTSLSSSDITSSTNTALNTAQSPTMILSFSRNVSYQPRPLPTLPFLCSRSLQGIIMWPACSLTAPGLSPPTRLELDLESLGADFYTGNLHKWRYAPKGTAFLWVARQHRDQVLVWTAGDVLTSLHVSDGAAGDLAPVPGHAAGPVLHAGHHGPHQLPLRPARPRLLHQAGRPRQARGLHGPGAGVDTNYISKYFFMVYS